MARPTKPAQSSKGSKPPAGLVPPKPASLEPRPTRAAIRLPPPLPAAPKQESLDIRDRRALAVKQRAIATRVNQSPELAVMLLINPVLAMEMLGVNLSPEVARHVLHRTRHPVQLRERREALEVSLTQALDEAPRPSDPEWVAWLLFEKLQLEPLVTAAHVPIYLPPVNAEMLRALQKLRPRAKQRYRQPRRLTRKASIAVAPWTPAVRRMNLEAPVPQLARANTTPTAVPLEQLWFYKDQHHLARAVLELGIIQRQAFPVHTPDAFRRIRDGAKPNAFRSWIRAVRFPEREG